MHQFRKFIFGMKLYMFRTVHLSIIKSLFTVHSAVVYVIQLSSRTRMELQFHPGWNCSSILVGNRGELSYLAPLGSKIFPPLISSSVDFGGGIYPPQTESNTTPPSPKTEITNILFYILNLWLRIYCSGLRGCDTREKEIVIWPCWCFMADIIFTLLSLLLCL